MRTSSVAEPVQSMRLQCVFLIGICAFVTCGGNSGFEMAPGDDNGGTSSSPLSDVANDASGRWRPKATLVGHEDVVRSVAFSPKLSPRVATTVPYGSGTRSAARSSRSGTWLTG
jgi:hypothetical protein